MNIRNKKITVIGAKKSGIALANLILSLGGIPKISDSAKKESIKKETLDFIDENNILCEFSGHTKEFILDSDIVVLSPAVRITSDIVKWAKDNNVLVFGEIEFAFQFCSTPIIAVTGTNGKTTTSTLIHKVIEESGRKSCLCGNIGNPFSDYVLQSEDYDYMVLEISSFQMESVFDGDFKKGDLDVKAFRPYISVILNISENHLDQHKDMQEYIDAKKRIFLNQTKDDFVVINSADPILLSLKNEIKSGVREFKESEIIDGTKIVNPNYLAVLEVSRLLNIEDKAALNVFNKFKGVEHRLEHVSIIDKVDYVNDSKSTTANATIWALNRIEKPIILICGGRDKNIDYSVISDLVKQKVKKIIVIGEAKEKIKNALSSAADVLYADDLSHAVSEAKRLAQHGDCVLLSPMCASFDMFENFEHRGKIFKEIVNELKNSGLSELSSLDPNL